jgi:uncharacterized membrane protein HdeD (DUF308 family)
MSVARERAADAAVIAKRRVDAKLGDIWWAILLRGLLALGLAVCAFVWPERTLGIFVKLLGAYFLIDGIIGAVGVYRSGDRASPLMQTVVSLTIGLVLLFWTGISARLFLILVGVWLTLQGISLFLAAFRMSPAEKERTPTMAIGAIMLLVGALFVFWTDTGVVAISWLVGLAALVIGALLIYLATLVKRLQAKFDSLSGPI